MHATLGAALQSEATQGVNMVPAAMLLAKSKQFDDGLLAAVELAMSNGLGRLPSRNAFVEKIARLLQKLQKRGQIEAEAEALLAAASKLAGRPVATKPAVARGVESLLSRFLRSQKSKPISFLPWRPGLERVFRRDRLLQRKLERGPGLALARLLARRKVRNKRYQRFLELEARLTNPPRHRSLTRLVRAVRRGRTPRWPRRRTVALFPAAQSPEDALIERVYGNRPVPEGPSAGSSLTSSSVQVPQKVAVTRSSGVAGSASSTCSGRNPKGSARTSTRRWNGSKSASSSAARMAASTR